MHTLIFSITLFALPGCNGKRIVKKKVTLTPVHHAHNFTADQSPPSSITVWIHGTRLLRRPLFHEFFESRPCLKRADLLDERYHLRQIADTLTTSAPHLFSPETFYLLGWSGRLSAIEREEAAAVLYTQLQEIINDYQKKYGFKPTIRIIAHSHGGNIALNLVKIEKPAGLIIDELILLAVPVQANTKNFIGDAMFKKVYVLYSSLDLAQVIAPQVVYKTSKTKKGHVRAELKIPPLSERRFPAYDNVTQVKIKLDGRAPLHGELGSPRFLVLLTQIMQEIDAWHIHEHCPTLSPDISTQLLCIYTKRISHTHRLKESPLLS